MATDSLRSRFAHLPVGMYQTTPGPQGRFLDANAALAEILGAASVDELLGHPPASFYLQPSNRDDFHGRVRAHGAAREEFCLLTLDGRLAWVVKAAQYREVPGFGTVIEGTLEDVTDSRVVEQRLTLALDAGGLGVFELDPLTGSVAVDGRLLTLYGLSDPEDLASYEQWRSMVLPEDLPDTEAAVHHASAKTSYWDVTFRIMRPDGACRTVRSFGRQLLGVDGAPVRQVGINEDITDRQEAEDRLLAQKQWLEEAQQIARLGYWVSYPRGDHAHGALWWSEMVYAIFGQDPEQFTPSIEAFYALVHPADRDAVDTAIRNADRHGGFSVEHRILRPDGDVRWVSELGRVIYGEEAQVDRVIGVVQDITEQRALREELAYHAAHDPLTALFNRRQMRLRLEQAYAAYQRHGTPFALILLDIDRFKQLNDAHGHVSGDQVLRQVAEAMDTALRTEDTASRWGGEEFLILLERSDQEPAAELAERLRMLIAESIFEVHAETMRTTVSAGVAAIKPGLSLDDLISRADQAMYRAKAAGRNQVVVWGREGL
ncbi:sensor domain-containing diguanylate cyclase [Halorhodospira sp. 9622]|uniref:sensor domain-containing diguanylate cyclase n=1 Tax=Halorhodospira sp. 9622 TaxID=2899136 RepID=UPI001EE7DCFF|nr:sensor domain-containing diguanylate cyclase [Halorhodospira sp. 9622]MCG5538851.1 diguanylate cyclase [Halorhodospira sp. 9622]